MLKLTDDEVTHLSQSYFWQATRGYEERLSAQSVYPNVLRNRATRFDELVASGYIRLLPARAEDQGVVYGQATNLIMGYVKGDMPFLIDVWQARYQKDQRFRMPFVYFEDLTLAQKVWALGEEKSYRWYLVEEDVKKWPQGYTDDQRTPQLGFPMASNVREIEEAHKTSRRANAISMRYYDLVLTRDTLEQKVEQFFFEKHVEETIGNNLGWFLGELKIVEPSRAEQILSTDTPGWVMGSSSLLNLGNVPEEWEANLRNRLGQVADSLTRRSEDMRLLLSVLQGVQIAGGWPKFIDQARVMITKRLLEEKNAKEEKPSA
jgi:hypothetical protein